MRPAEAPGSGKGDGDAQWDGGWDHHLRAQLEAWSRATPAQLLAWLEDALALAHEAGALSRGRPHPGVDQTTAMGPSSIVVQVDPTEGTARPSARELPQAGE